MSDPTVAIIIGWIVGTVCGQLAALAILVFWGDRVFAWLDRTLGRFL